MRSGVEKPQCVLYHAVLSAESIKLSKLERYLKAKHPTCSDKCLEFFKRHPTALSVKNLTTLVVYLNRVKHRI